MRIVLAFLALLALAGCGSSPKTHFFTLSVTSGTKAAQGVSGLSVQVAAVHIPASLDRNQMVWQTGANAMHVSDRDRWTAPLGRMTRRVLTQDLTARLPENTVILPDAPTPPGTAQIVVTLDQFGPDGQGKVALSGSWSLLRGSSAKPVLHRNVAFATTASGKGGGAMAASMSALLGRLAQHMARAIVHEGGSPPKGS